MTSKVGPGNCPLMTIIVRFRPSQVMTSSLLTYLPMVPSYSRCLWEFSTISSFVPFNWTSYALPLFSWSLYTRVLSYWMFRVNSHTFEWQIFVIDKESPLKSMQSSYHHIISISIWVDLLVSIERLRTSRRRLWLYCEIHQSHRTPPLTHLQWRSQDRFWGCHRWRGSWVKETLVQGLLFFLQDL